MPLNIAVIMTVFNRKATTLACLSKLEAQRDVSDQFTISVTIVDDASTDGTADAVSATGYPFPVKILHSPGDLFWARGMAVAHRVASADQPDLILWLNDDVELDIDAIERMVNLALNENMKSIVVGATRSPNGADITYTGARRRSIRPGSLVSVSPQSEHIEIDAFNGNCVLVPKHCYSALGSVDQRFEHAYGDIDYGLRARSAGFRVLLLADTVGTCAGNTIVGTWRDPEVSRLLRFRGLFGRKGHPLRSHWLFNSRHGGVFGFAFFAATYVQASARILSRTAIGGR